MNAAYLNITQVNDNTICVCLDTFIMNFTPLQLRILNIHEFWNAEYAATQDHGTVERSVDATYENVVAELHNFVSYLREDECMSDEFNWNRLVTYVGKQAIKELVADNNPIVKFILE